MTLLADGARLGLTYNLNRNKRSYVSDLKKPADLDTVRQRIARADVLIQKSM
ncbi:MAG TPA: CoA transferase [Pararobbsia sp.]|nr:CoA transferase [Pararobbsia sp.]